MIKKYLFCNNFSGPMGGKDPGGIKLWHWILNEIDVGWLFLNIDTSIMRKMLDYVNFIYKGDILIY